jgi:O-glycosyl hydrolase
MKSSMPTALLFKIELHRPTNLFRIQNSATPWWNLTYDEQLLKKAATVNGFLSGLEQKIKQNGYAYPSRTDHQIRVTHILSI